MLRRSGRRPASTRPRRTDLPLLDEGRGKAEQLGRDLARDDVAAVMVSPLLRARQTCELAGFGSDAHVRVELTEWNYGRYEGLTTEQVHRQAPDWNLWRDGAPNGESPAQVQRRFDTLLVELSRPERRGNVLVFAHGHVLQALRCAGSGSSSSTVLCSISTPPVSAGSAGSAPPA